ncbi:hypothetical protein [Oscillatoria sp. FACHB-1406]|uniref:hypothetical protein n=1 Tax=Oscillatoria sp. FACHB-1406 TaxID=2692846 RepID=UPI0018EF5878|nr:hypothetical protein [Oscillatoria sp. FACHB-1406]
MCISDIVEQALTTSYLSLEAEESLRQLLRRKYGKEDLQAFMTLQKAVMNCCVVQESRQLQQMAG